MQTLRERLAVDFAARVERESVHGDQPAGNHIGGQKCGGLLFKVDGALERCQAIVLFQKQKGRQILHPFPFPDRDNSGAGHIFQPYQVVFDVLQLDTVATQA